MGPRSSILLGVLAGLVVAVVIYVGLVALAPETGTAATPAPSLAPSPSPSASPAPTASEPTASGSASPVGSTDPGGGPSPDASAAALFMIGQPAPALHVEQLGGGSIDLANLKGKPVWLTFMATWCPSCRDELPRMTDFATRYADTGLVVLAIDVREDESVVAPYMSSVGVTFPVGLDADGSAQAAWKGLALPVHYWVDASGTIRAGAFGGIGPDVMASSLETILPGVDVTP